MQLAFGVDANEDGELCPAETDLVLGWDCGAWFIRDERAEWSHRWTREAGTRELRAFVRVTSRGHALRDELVAVSPYRYGLLLEVK